MQAGDIPDSYQWKVIELARENPTEAPLGGDVNTYRITASCKDSVLATPDVIFLYSAAQIGNTNPDNLPYDGDLTVYFATAFPQNVNFVEAMVEAWTVLEC